MLYKPCKYCGKDNHTSLMCFNKPRRAINKMSAKTLGKHHTLRKTWFEQYPPNPKGTWDCYLQISEVCPKKVTSSTIRLEHVKSKARYPELKYEVSNIKPSCDPCNKLKGSLDIADLAIKYPHRSAFWLIIGVLNKETLAQEPTL